MFSILFVFIIILNKKMGILCSCCMKSKVGSGGPRLVDEGEVVKVDEQGLLSKQSNDTGSSKIEKNEPTISTPASVNPP